MEKSIKDADLDLQGLLREIDEAELKCTNTLEKLRQKRLELTGEDLIEFTVSTIHKDRIGFILGHIEKIEKDRGYMKLRDEWRSTSKATSDGWFGTIKSKSTKERLISIMPKIAKHGGTITIEDPSVKIEIPPPNKWWDHELEAQIDAEKSSMKEA